MDSSCRSLSKRGMCACDSGPQLTVRRTSRRRLLLKPYRFTLVQEISDEGDMTLRECYIDLRFIYLMTEVYCCWEEHRLKVFENRILRLIFASKRDENGSREGFTIRNFMVCIVHVISPGIFCIQDSGGKGMLSEWEKAGMFFSMLTGTLTGM